MVNLLPIEQRRILVTDIGGTITGDRKYSEIQDEINNLRQKMAQVQDVVTLVYSSGQNLQGILEKIEQYQLIVPDYVISSVGTEIHRMPGEHPLDEWYQYIRPGFQREQIVAYMAKNYPRYELQPGESQTPLKISYFVEQASQEKLQELRQQMLKAQLPARLVYSADLYLDIIPERAGMGTSVKFLTDSLVLSPSQVFVCGDSGNDIDLFQYGFRGIVVANASHELKEAVELSAYFSHTPYAQGLLEGLEHYRFFERLRLQPRRDTSEEALERAIDSLRRNITPMGFSAASLADNRLTKEYSNYFAVWSRDGIKTGLWSLCLNDAEITECFRRTLQLMAEHQTKSGQIPANVQIKTGTPDYAGIGGIASIDSVLWFVIGAIRFVAYTGDLGFLDWIYPSLEKAMTWLRAHDSNNCSLLEVPESSDWMDLFPRSYNVLYDEVLWYLACRDFGVVRQSIDEHDQEYTHLAERIRLRILRQFWPTAEKLSEARESFSETQFSLGEAQYLLAQISPFGFSWRCDVYANLLAALVGLLDEGQMEQVFHFLWGVGANSPYPIKCYYPPILSGAQDWKDYFVTNFLNLPDHYHNGGIWPFIGGLWVRFLAQIGRTELARQELNALSEACRLGIYADWEFNEWLHGQTGRPMGKAHQAWSAASYVAAWKGLNQDTIASDFKPLSVEMFTRRTED